MASILEHYTPRPLICAHVYKAKYENKLEVHPKYTAISYYVSWNWVEKRLKKLYLGRFRGGPRARRPWARARAPVCKRHHIWVASRVSVRMACVSLHAYTFSMTRARQIACAWVDLAQAPLESWVRHCVSREGREQEQQNLNLFQKLWSFLNNWLMFGCATAAAAHPTSPSSILPRGSKFGCCNAAKRRADEHGADW